MVFTKQYPNVAACIAFSLAICALGTTVFLGLYTAHLSAVTTRQQSVQAVVVSLGNWNHGQTYNYRFKVDGENFSGNSLAPDDVTPVSHPAITRVLG